MKKYPLINKSVAVLGAGKSGISAANLAKKLGAEVLLSESKNTLKTFPLKISKGIKVELNGHTQEVLYSDIIIKSPGILSNIPIIIKARRKNIPVLSEVEFALKYSKYKRIVAVTGTNGKTTVATLIGKVLKEFSKNVTVAGNIGNPVSYALKKGGKNPCIVIEMSSYQLEDSNYFKPDVSLVLNITKDHVAHHGCMKKYMSAKEKVFKFQSKNRYCVLNYDDKTVRAMKSRCPSKVIYFSLKEKIKSGVYFKGGVIVSSIPKKNFSFPLKTKLPGYHNIENILAGVAVCTLLGVKPAVICRAITKFKGVEHRIEFVKKLNGVSYFNDSKSTNVDSTKAALGSFKAGIWLIMGGRDKGAPYGPLTKYIKSRVKGLFLIGEASKVIEKQLKGLCPVFDCKNIPSAVIRAYSSAKNGDIVLLSPGCASFDQYLNFEERGKHFKSIVNKL